MAMAVLYLMLNGGACSLAGDSTGTTTITIAVLADRVKGGEVLRDAAMQRALSDRVIHVVLLLFFRLDGRVGFLQFTKVLALGDAQKVHEDLHHALVRAALVDSLEWRLAELVEHRAEVVVEALAVTRLDRREGRARGADLTAPLRLTGGHGADELEHVDDVLEVVLGLVEGARLALTRDLNLVHLGAAERWRIRHAHTHELIVLHNNLTNSDSDGPGGEEGRGGDEEVKRGRAGRHWTTLDDRHHTFLPQTFQEWTPHGPSSGVQHPALEETPPVKRRRERRSTRIQARSQASHPIPTPARELGFCMWIAVRRPLFGQSNENHHTSGARGGV